MIAWTFSICSVCMDFFSFSISSCISFVPTLSLKFISIFSKDIFYRDCDSSYKVAWKKIIKKFIIFLFLHSLNWNHLDKRQFLWYRSIMRFFHLFIESQNSTSADNEKPGVDTIWSSGNFLPKYGAKIRQILVAFFELVLYPYIFKLNKSLTTDLSSCP